MSSRGILVVSGVLAAICFGCGGFYVGWLLSGTQTAARDFAEGLDISYTDAALRAYRDVGYLQHLRAGDIRATGDALEAHLDGELSYLATYHDYIPPPARRKSVYQAVEAVRSYRSTYPSSLPPGRERDAMLRGLALAPDASKAAK